MSGELERCCLSRSLLSFNGRSAVDGGGILRPDLAESLPQVTRNGLTWTFHLRRGIHYGPPLQGVSVTAGDFVRSFERLLAPPPSWLSEDFGSSLDAYVGDYLNLSGSIVGAKAFIKGRAQHISGLQVPDNYTLVVHLTQASGSLGYLLALPDTAPIPPVAAHPEWRFGAAQGHDRFYFSYLVSTGPYMIAGAPKLDFSKPPPQQLPASGDAPQSLTLVRNPSWRAASDPLRAALPDRIQLVAVKDPRVAQRLIREDAIDFAFNWGPSRLQPGPNPPQSPVDVVRHLDLNLGMPPLNDLHVRRAINFAIARRPLLHAWAKSGRPGVPETHVGLDDEENDLLLNFDPYHAATGNIRSAKREMALSRFDRNHDGRCDGRVCSGIRLWTEQDRPEQVATARKVARDLKRIGLGVRVYAPALDRFFSPFQDPTVHPQMILETWIKDTLSPTTYFAPLFGGPSLQVTGAYDFNQSNLGSSPAQLKRWGYHVRHVPSVDGRIRQCVALTFAEQVRCYAELDQYLTTRVVPWVPLISDVTGGRGTSSRVSHVAFNPSINNPMPSLDRVLLRSNKQLAPLPRQAHPVPPIPDGVYRYTLTRSDRLRFDPNFDRANLGENTGTTTTYLRHGWFESVERARHLIPNPITVGIYKGRGHRVTFDVEQPTLEEAPPSGTVAPLLRPGAGPTLTWRFDGHALHFRLVQCGDLSKRNCKDVRANYQAHPWIKVADLP